MNALLPIIKSLDEHIVEDLRAEFAVSHVGPFELIAASEFQDQYSSLVRSFWRPISGHYVGRFISRYISGFVALPTRSPVLGVHAISPHIFLYRSASEFTPEDLCYYTFRRAMFLRQNALNVNRSILTKRIIAKRTSAYVLNSRMGLAISSLYSEEAEQVGADDAEEAV